MADMQVLPTTSNWQHYYGYVYFWLLDLFSNAHINGNHVYGNIMIFVMLWKCRKFRQVICSRFFSHRVRHTLIDWFCKATEERKIKEIFFFFSRIIPNIIWKKIINFRYILNVFNLVYNFAASFGPFPYYILNAIFLFQQRPLSLLYFQ